MRICEGISVKQSVVSKQGITKIYPALPKELFKYYSRKGWVYGQKSKKSSVPSSEPDMGQLKR
ncbi:MAG: hypothetical protein AB1633_01690 [Elusimicrobiota bacterium]